MVGPANRTDANLEGRGDIPPALAGSPALDYLGTVEDDLRSADSHAILLGGLNAGGNTLSDQLTLELSDRGQDVHQQRGCGARVIRVQSLRNSNEPDAERLQCLTLRARWRR
jgi:hypothetical protein